MEGLTLETIAGGAAGELFEIALVKILRNILDVNADVKKTRSVELKISFQPYEDRSGAEIKVHSAKLVLAGSVPVNARISIFRENDQLLAMPQRDHPELFADNKED